ncbi:MAG TPA: hypothetical protein VGK99_21445 [Acidobacteriota bacterium]|jgi:hypothetical protein
MKFIRFALIIILSGWTVLAQDRRESSPRAESSDARGSRDMGESRVATINTPAAPAPSTGSNNNSNNNYGGSSNYNPYNGYYGDYYRWQEFMTFLRMRGYWDLDWAGRYQRREPLLTDQAVQIGLHEPLLNAGSLLATAVELRDLVNRMDQDSSVRASVQEKVTYISRLIKDIRKDPMLSYIDLRQSDDETRIASNQDLKSLAEQLVSSALALHADLDRMVRENPKVVRVSELSSRSYRAVSKEIENLAKEIGKRAKKS